MGSGGALKRVTVVSFSLASKSLRTSCERFSKILIQSNDSLGGRRRWKEKKERQVRRDRDTGTLKDLIWLLGVWEVIVCASGLILLGEVEEIDV
jgi:hypothetical protein